MSPEFLPHFFLLMVGIFLGGVALHRLLGRRWGSALKLGGLSIALIGFAILGGKAASWKASNALGPEPTGLPLVPADSTKKADSMDQPAPMTLVLGGVRIRVLAADQYEFSARDQIFLTVSSVGSGLVVSCSAAGTEATQDPRYLSHNAPRVAASIQRNFLDYTAGGVRVLRPDPHTMVVEEEGAEILRVHFPESHVLEIDGQMCLPTSQVRLERGIAWPGNFIPPGPLDLTGRGKGRIDLEPSGTVRVVSR